MMEKTNDIAKEILRGWHVSKRLRGWESEVPWSQHYQHHLSREVLEAGVAPILSFTLLSLAHRLLVLKKVH
jgi:hypothetical protein